MGTDIGVMLKALTPSVLGKVPK